MMKIIVSNNIQIIDPPESIREWAEEEFTLDNPDFYKKEKLGKWLGGTPRTIALYEWRGNVLTLPFGALSDVWDKHPYKVDWIYDIKPIEPIEYKSNINLYPYQENAVNAVISAKNGILVMPCGSGKGLPLDAKIYTPTGYKRNGDLQIGDKVIGSDGKPISVTGIYDRGLVDAYKITFSDDTTIVCDKDHLWAVQKQTQRVDGGRWWTETAEQIYKHYENIKRQDLYYIPIVKPVEFEQKPITINPWLLGFLIGDGCFGKAMTFSTSEQDLIERVKKLTEDKVKYKGKYDYYFSGGQIKKLISDLKLNGCRSWEKHIPENYKYNSVDVRLALLQGLFDADGYNGGKGIYEYSTVSKQLADDIIEIVESLGGTAKTKEKKPSYMYKGQKKMGRTSYRIFFKLYEFEPFTSEKHKARSWNRSKYSKAYRIIKKIEPTDPIVSRCIKVDAEDELYVTDHFVVTHNTQVGLEIVSRIGGTCLWLTHTQDLLNQSKKRAESVLDVPDRAFGTITEGKVNIGTHITFATVQTMCRVDLSKYRNWFDVIIVDEVHKVSGSPTRVTQFYKVLSSLSARYKIGLTATPKRADGLERSMFALLGNKAYEVTRKEVETTTCPIMIERCDTGYAPDLDRILNGDGTISYTEVVNDLIENEDRAQFIIDKINEHADEPMIVLANRIAYLERLQNGYKGTSVCLSGAGQSKKAKAERKEALRKLNDGEIDAVFATYQLAREGLDVPNLRYVVFATPEKEETTIIQSAGRVGRKADGKDHGTVIDFVDDFGMFYGWQKKRQRCYKKIGAKNIF